LPARLEEGPLPRRPAVEVRRDAHTGTASLHISAGAPGRKDVPFRYAVYRFPRDPGRRPEAEYASLVAVIPGGKQAVHYDADASGDCWYAVSAIDRVQRQGRLSHPAR
ncbi:hypothetical protein ACIP27_39055, partial [Streptomyces hydrogenans]